MDDGGFTADQEARIKELATVQNRSLLVTLLMVGVGGLCVTLFNDAWSVLRDMVLVVIHHTHVGFRVWWE